ncbi:MAG: hypothetical protein II830_02060 [Alphaproteobacteria bacterium]|nr:hypothetical protein [Alphaproteobacteria bacterium]
MVDVPRKADRLSVENGKDLLAFAGIIAFGVMIFLALAWGWIKIYPQF